MRSIDLSGRHALILGVANHRSLAWAIAEALGDAGCELAFTYADDRIEGKVRKLAEKYPDAPVLPCDVTRDDAMDAVFGQLQERWGKLDTMIHSIAFAPREALAGRYIDTDVEAWRVALEVSAYSLVALSRRAEPLMKAAGGGNILALSYVASQRVVARYNVMGSAKAALEHAMRQLAFELGPSNIRVNAISAGPVNTLSARGVSGFSSILGHYEEKAPLGRNITQQEVADAALFLSSGMASGITGELLYVDAGYNIMAP